MTKVINLHLHEPALGLCADRKRLRLIFQHLVHLDDLAIAGHVDVRCSFDTLDCTLHENKQSD